MLKKVSVGTRAGIDGRANHMKWTSQAGYAARRWRRRRRRRHFVAVEQAGHDPARCRQSGSPAQQRLSQPHGDGRRPAASAAAPWTKLTSRPGPTPQRSAEEQDRQHGQRRSTAAPGELVRGSLSSLSNHQPGRPSARLRRARGQTDAYFSLGVPPSLISALQIETNAVRNGALHLSLRRYDPCQVQRVRTPCRPISAGKVRLPEDRFVMRCKYCTKFCPWCQASGGPRRRRTS